MSKKVLVTGAAGFLGRHVSKLLAAGGYTVSGIGHGPWRGEDWQAWGIAEWHEAGITLEALNQMSCPKIIFHCAGASSVGHSFRHPLVDFERTVAATSAVLEYARCCSPCASVVLPSSAAVYGEVSELPIGVHTPLKPTSPYGAHKAMAEELCRLSGTHFGVRTSIVRLFSVYGVGLRKQLLWDACKKLAAGDTEFEGTGSETRDWIHVDDAAALLIRAAGKAMASPAVVNGGGGVRTSIRQVVELLTAEFGVKDVRFNGTRRPGDPPHYCAGNGEALQWGWLPLRDLNEEVKLYAKWFLRGAI